MGSGDVLVSVLDRLSLYYEEAESRLLLHASHAPESMARIFVVSPDTDVAVLLSRPVVPLRVGSLAALTSAKSLSTFLVVSVVYMLFHEALQ